MAKPSPAQNSSPHHRRDPLIGVVVKGQYRIEELLGLGGMGAVYRATQLAVDRPVALKVLRHMGAPAVHPGMHGDPQLVERFRREAMATSRLRHPNTVQVIDFGQTDEEMLFMVLELLEGSPLSSVIAHDGPMPPTRVASIAKQIAKSLAEAHALGIVHRDLKPDNIFICDYHGESDYVKVMDFGIARVLSVEDNMTRTGMMIGTPKYMAPEQAMARKVGPAADIYALGIMMYEMMTGEPPYTADSGMALALAHINEPVPILAMEGFPDALGEAWRSLVRSMLSKNADHRPQRAADVAQWLQQLEHETQRWFDSQYQLGIDPIPTSIPVHSSGRSATPVPIETLSMRVADTPPPGYNLPGFSGSVWQSPASLTSSVTGLGAAARRRPRRRKRQRALLWAAILFMIAGGVVAAMLLKPVKKDNVTPIEDRPRVTQPKSDH